MRVLVIGLAAGLIVSATAVPAAAQGERAYPALFGTSVGETAQQLTLDVKFGGGYDGNVATLGGADPANPAFQSAPASKVATTSANLGYGLSRATFAVQAAASGWAKYYPVFARPVVRGGGGSLGASWNATSKTTLSVDQSVTDQPLFIVAAVPVAPEALNLPVDAAPTVGTTTRLDTQLTTATGIGLNSKLTPRLSLLLNGRYFKTQQISQAPALATFAGSAGLSFALTKSLGLRVGYGRTEARYDIAGERQRSAIDSIDAGVTFGRALSLTRHTHLSFATGTAVVKDRSQTTFRLNGNVLITRDIGRSWEATAGYSRDVGYLQAFTRPVFSDSVGLGLGGAVSRRVQVQTGAGFSRGNVGIGVASNGFTTYYGKASVTVGISRELAFSLNYAYLHYVYQSGVVLPDGLARRLDRQNVSATLDVWMPLFRVLRRPDATR